MFTSYRYFPEVGDLVNYKDELKVIVRTEMLSIGGDYIAYLLSKELLEDFKDFTETKNLISKCTLQRYNPVERYFPFTPIGKLTIEIEEKSYIKIHLKE